MTKTEFIQRKRRFAFLLSAMTTLLFLTFVCLIALSPERVSGELFILLGFILIAGSSAIVTAYGIWADRLQQRLESEGVDHA